MTLRTARISIVGGGLSGLYAAFLLDQQGIHDWVLLESRATLGGRILSLSVGSDTTTPADVAPRDRFDLGPTWFWPDLQPELTRLVATLGLECFDQHETGEMLVEHTPLHPPQRSCGDASAPSAVRLMGGMAALVDAMTRRLDPTRIHTGHTVCALQLSDDHVTLACAGPDGVKKDWQAGQVLLALPPRLAAQTLRFEPALPDALQRHWQDTPTWMAPHAKFLAVYDRPFWRDQGLSGEARSARGPMVEVHDASMPGGRGALFGFVGVPARVRQGLADGLLQTHCLAQLVRLFGDAAAAPRATFLKDWSSDLQTATAADLDATGQHVSAPAATPAAGPWRGRMAGIASEWSPQFPGYLAGCVDAAGAGVRALVAHA